MNVNTVVKCVTKMGESPYWDDYDRTLKFVDINEGKLLSYCPKDESVTAWAMKDVIGSANCAGENKSVVALRRGVCIFDLKTGEFEDVFKRPIDEYESSRFNDSKCDSRGRLWVGSTSMERKPVASLYKVAEDISVEMGGLTISNGMAWSKDNETYYHIDTWPRKIYKCAYDIDSGEILSREVAFELDESLNYPDGMTIDREDKLWIAFWGGSCVCRFDPDSGQMLSKIEMPVKFPTCCTFGGEDYSTLFITSAVSNDTSELAGSLFSVDLPIGGVPHKEFENLSGIRCERS